MTTKHSIKGWTAIDQGSLARIAAALERIANLLDPQTRQEMRREEQDNERTKRYLANVNDRLIRNMERLGPHIQAFVDKVVEQRWIPRRDRDKLRAGLVQTMYRGYARHSSVGSLYPDDVCYRLSAFVRVQSPGDFYRTARSIYNIGPKTIESWNQHDTSQTNARKSRK